MKKKNVFIAAIIMATLLTACGPSDEKLAEATQAISTMTQAMETVNNTYLDITDSSFKARIDELSAKETELSATALDKLSDKEIDELLPQINEVTGQLTALNEEMSKVLGTEEAQRQENDRHNEQKAYLINKTGMNLTEIRLLDKTTGTLSDNYLGDGVILQSGYTLMGVSLDVYSTSSSWEFVIKSEADTEYNLPCTSLLPVNEEGVSIELYFDPETGEGSANIGGYAAVQETEDAEAASEADSGDEEASESASTEASGQ